MQSNCRLAFALGLTLWLALPGGQAQAQETSEEKEMLRISAEGAVLYKNGRFQEAIQKFEKAYAFVPEANILFNLGRCHQSLGQVEEAIAYYQRFIAQPGISEADRARAVRRIETLRQRLNARYGPQEGQQDAPGTRAQVTSAPRPAPARKVRQILEWSLIGAGATAVIAGGIFGGLALGARGDFEAATTVSSKQSAKEDAKNRALVADIGIGVGLATLTTGVVLFFLDRPGPSRPRRAEVSFTPRFGPGQAGVVLGTRF